MVKPEKTTNESERLNALNKLNVLDTKAEERFDRFTRIAHKLFDVPIALISFVNEDRVWFKSQCGLEKEEAPRNITFCEQAILQDDVILIEDALKDPRFSNNPQAIGESKIRFYFGYPLKLQDQFNIGTLSLMDYKPRKFSPTDIDILKELGGMIETELDSSESQITDELTTLANRKGFISIGKQIIRRCNQYEKDVLLLFFDLNHFKNINSTYGHVEGDKILQVFAEQLLKNFRHSDAVARLGGDEFCVLCGGANKSQFPNIIKRFEKKLSSAHTAYPIEFTVGAVQYDRLKHLTIEALLEEADIKMYEQKRNRHSIGMHGKK